MASSESSDLEGLRRVLLRIPSRLRSLSLSMLLYRRLKRGTTVTTDIWTTYDKVNQPQHKNLQLAFGV